jgi:hypothetical protein
MLAMRLGVPGFEGERRAADARSGCMERSIARIKLVVADHEGGVPCGELPEPDAKRSPPGGVSQSQKTPPVKELRARAEF